MDSPPPIAVIRFGIDVESSELSPGPAIVVTLVRQTARPINQALQIVAILRLAMHCDPLADLGMSYPTIVQCDFLEASYLQPSPLFDRPHEATRIEQAFVRTGIEPSGSASEDFDL